MKNTKINIMKMNKFLLLTAWLLVSYATKAQSIKEYYQDGGDNVSFHAIVPVSNAINSDLYVVGNYGDQLFVAQMNQGGYITWVKGLLVNDADFMVNSILVDSDGKIVFCGGESTGVDDNSNGFIAKFDPATTTLLWFKQTSSLVACFDLVEAGAGGNYFVSGQDEGLGTGNQADHLVLSVDRTSGATSVISNLDKNINETAQCIVYDNISSSLYTSGRYELSNGASKFRICLTKMDESGDIDFTKFYIKDLASTGRFYTEDMLIDDTGIIMVGCGDDAGTSTFKHLYFLRAGLDGSISDVYQYDITGTDNDGILASVKKYEDGYILFGLLNDGVETDVFLMNINESGAINWAKSYNYKKKTNPSGYYATGSLAIIGDYIFHVGERIMPDESTRGVLLKTPIATGNTGSCDVDLSMTLSAAVSPYESSVSLLTATSSPSFSAATLTIEDISFNGIQSCYQNGQDTLFQEISLFSNVVNSTALLVNPNPNNGTFNIEIENAQNDKLVNILILNISGQVVYENKQFNLQDEIQISNLPNGIYVAAIKNELNRFILAKSFVIE